MKKIVCLINVLFILLLVRCADFGSGKEVLLDSIYIVKDTTNVEELNVLVGDKFALGTMLSDEVEAEITWETSNPDVVTIDGEGNVEVIGKGKAII